MTVFWRTRIKFTIIAGVGRMQVGLGQVRAFITVAATRNFTRASDVLGLSQPALTTRIQQFEEALGLKLFDRSARGVELTGAGREILPHFSRLLNEFETAVTDAKNYAIGRQGAIRIACLPSCAATLLPEWIVRFRKENATSPIIVRDAINSRIAAMVRDNETDFGIATSETGQFDLHSTHLMRDRLFVVCPRNHPLENGGNPTVAEIATYPLILTAKGSSVRDAVERAFASTGLPVRPVCEATYMSTAVAMVKAGLGIAILPSTAVELRNDDIYSRPINDLAFERSVVLLKRKDAALSPAAENFAKIILQWAKSSIAD